MQSNIIGFSITSIIEALNIICLHLGQVTRQNVKDLLLTILCLDEVKTIIIPKPALQIYAQVEPEALTSYGQHKLDFDELVA